MVALAVVAIVSGIIIALLASSDSTDLAVAAPIEAPVQQPTPAPAPVEPATTVPLQGRTEGAESTAPPGTVPELGEPVPGVEPPLSGAGLLPGGSDPLEPQPLEPPNPGEPLPPGQLDPSELTPPPDAPPLVVVELTDWPLVSGYTVVLASIPENRGIAAAEAQGARARAAGLSEVGVLRSSDYSSLRPGYWATFSGVYDTLNEARTELPSARAAGFPSAYTRRVAR